MRFLPFALAFLGLLPLSSGAESVRTRHVTAELIPERDSFQADGAEDANRVGIRLEMEPGWHTYWRFPGDSGLPTEIVWELPRGWAAGEPLWPLPKRILVPPLVNYGYDGAALIGVPIQVPAGASGEQRLTAHVSWLVCKQECVPEKADLHLVLRVGKEAGKLGSQAPLFRSLAREQPAKQARGFARAIVERGRIGLSIPPTGGSVDFFPLAPLIVKGDRAPEAESAGGRTVLWLEKSDPFDDKAKTLPGVLVARGAGGELKALEISADLQAAPASSAVTSAPPGDSSPWLLVAFAFLGGFILNLMPCVFPVLGIKVMSLVRQSGAEKGHARIHGQAYAAGVVASFWALAAALLALRAAGQAVGWGFQLQQPMFVMALILLFTFVAADLAGYIHWSGRWMGAGSGLAEKEGLGGSFFTGVLAVVVATPCTAPFMGTAIGAAIGEPGWVIFLVFTALGLGLAVPFVLLTFQPSWLQALPRPGAWMERLKELFAFPIAATVLWLLWVLTLQIGAENALKVETGLLVLIASAWARRRFAGPAARAVSVALLLLGLAMCVLGSRSGTGGAGLAAGGSWRPFSEKAVAEAVAAGKPVFVDFTAAWCLTCQLNKKLVLDRAGMQDFLREKGVQLFLADWTNRDPAITKALENEGRIGVPLYLAYPAGSSQAEVLPQILTEERIRAAFR